MITSVTEFEGILDENILVAGGFSNTELYKKSMKPQIEEKFPKVLDKINEINAKLESSLPIKVSLSTTGELSSETKEAVLQFASELTMEESLSLEYQLMDSEELLEARGTILASTIGYVVTTLKTKKEELSGTQKSAVCEKLLEEAMNAREILITEIFGELNQKAQAIDFLKMYLKNYLAYIINPIREFSLLVKEDEVELLEMSDKEKEKNEFYLKMRKLMKASNNIGLMIGKVDKVVDPLIEEKGIGNTLYPSFISAVSSIKTNSYISSFY